MPLLSAMILIACPTASPRSVCSPFALSGMAAAALETRLLVGQMRARSLPEASKGSWRGSTSGCRSSSSHAPRVARPSASGTLRNGSAAFRERLAKRDVLLVEGVVLLAHPHQAGPGGVPRLVDTPRHPGEEETLKEKEEP